MVDVVHVRGKGQLAVISLYHTNLLISSLRTTLRKRERDLPHVSNPELRVAKINEIQELKKLITAYETISRSFE